MKFIELSTTRVLLQQIKVNNAEDFWEMRSNPKIMKYIPRPIAQNIDDIYTLIELYDNAFINGAGRNWAIVWKENNKMIGTIGFVKIDSDNNMGEIGYLLHPDYQKKGILNECMLEVMKFGFNSLDFHSITAIIHPDNIESQRVLERLHFRKEAHFKENFFYNNLYEDSVHFGILKNEFFEKNI